jgi:hypothetical protein
MHLVGVYLRHGLCGGHPRSARAGKGRRDGRVYQNDANSAVTTIRWLSIMYG